MNGEHEEIGEGDEGLVVVKTAPGAAFVVIEAEIVLKALEELLDLPARAGQEQAARPGGRGLEVGEKKGVGGGFARGPVGHEPGPFQLTVGGAQTVTQEDLGQARRVRRVEPSALFQRAARQAFCGRAVAISKSVRLGGAAGAT
jgi:hypothetical protein